MAFLCKPSFPLKRARGKRRPTVDGISTHCGFMEPTLNDPRQISHHEIIHACDRFMADPRRLGGPKIWVPNIAEYLTPADADSVTAALA